MRQGGPRAGDPIAPEAGVGYVRGKLRTPAPRAGEGNEQRMAGFVVQDPVSVLAGQRRAGVDRIRVLVNPPSGIPARLVVEVGRVHDHAPKVPAQELAVGMGLSARVPVEGGVRDAKEVSHPLIQAPGRLARQGHHHTWHHGGEDQRRQ